MVQKKSPQRKSPESHKGRNARLKPNLHVICYLRALGFLWEVKKGKRKWRKMFTQWTSGEAVKSGVHNY